MTSEVERPEFRARDGEIIAACRCGAGEVWPNKGMGRAFAATWRTRHQHSSENPTSPGPTLGVQHYLLGNVCLCGDWSAACGENVPEQWRQHVAAASGAVNPAEPDGSGCRVCKIAPSVTRAALEAPID